MPPKKLPGLVFRPTTEIVTDEHGKKYTVIKMERAKSYTHAS